MSDGTQRLKKAHRRSVIMVVIVTVILLVAIAIPAVRNYRENQLLHICSGSYDPSRQRAMSYVTTPPAMLQSFVKQRRYSPL